MKISLISTCFNEEEYIELFLNSIVNQTRLPNEVIIVDGGSTDKTLERIQKFSILHRKKIPFKVFQKKGNRSVGRNEAIRRAAGDIIAISDVGCILDKTWLEEIIRPFKKKEIEAVAGYYRAKTKTNFQKCLVPFALVMPDKVDPKSFLPATRSMAIKKSVWNTTGKFNEKLSHNEDYAFARQLRKKRVHIAFAKRAIVYWIPRKTVKEAYIMFYRFALGDIQAGIWRLKVRLLFLRYLLGIVLITLGIIYSLKQILLICLALFIAYILWSVIKNYRYVKKSQALYLLPLLQITSDVAVLHGSVAGLLSRRGLKEI